MAAKQFNLDVDEAARRIRARRQEALSYLAQARAGGLADDIDAWESLIRKFDKELARYGRTWN